MCSTNLTQNLGWTRLGSDRISSVCSTSGNRPILKINLPLSIIFNEHVGFAVQWLPLHVIIGLPTRLYPWWQIYPTAPWIPYLLLDAVTYPSDMAPGSLHTIAKAERNVYCLFSFYLISVSFSYFVFKTI